MAGKIESVGQLKLQKGIIVRMIMRVEAEEDAEPEMFALQAVLRRGESEVAVAKVLSDIVRATALKLRERELLGPGLEIVQ
jgi:hypothetical protein